MVAVKVMFVLDHNRNYQTVHYQGYVSAEASVYFINKEGKVEEKMNRELNILTTVKYRIY